MKLWLLFSRTVVLAASLLAVTLPVLAPMAAPQPSQADHAQMMAAAGHVAAMAQMDGPGDMMQQGLCQQHCRVAVATLPAGVHTLEHPVRVGIVAADDDVTAVSHSIAPRGRPPKAALV